MREPAPSPDCRLPTADCRYRERVSLSAWLTDLCGLGALALFVYAAQLWCGGIAG